MTTSSIILKRLSGDLLVIDRSVSVSASESESLIDEVWRALPEGERPVHRDKIRILDTEPRTLWIDPPERVLYVDLLGYVRDMEHGDEYARGSITLDEDGMILYHEEFYYRYDPLGLCSDILYHGKDVEYRRAMWHEEGDTIEIPSDIQAVTMDHFLPVEWMEHQEEWEEKMDDFCQDAFDGYFRQYEEQDEEQNEEQDNEEEEIEEEDEEQE